MIKTLIGVRLRALLGTSFGKKRRTGGALNSALTVLLLTFLGVVFVFFFAVMAFGMATVMLPAGLDALYFSIFMLCAFSVVFILSIFETKSELFECKDNELLLSMPIKPRHIVIARVFTVMIYNFVETAIVMLPAVVVYALLGGSLRGVFGGILMIFFLPLFATALASGVGYLVALIAKRMKKNTLLTVIFSLVFLAAYFIGYNYFINGMAALEDPNTDFGAIADSFGFVGRLGRAALLDPIWAVAVIAVCLTAAIGAYLIISASYIRIVTDVRGAKRREYRARSLKSSGPLLALTKKEIKKFFSSAAYILNAGIGLVFSVFLSAFALFKADTLGELSLELSKLSGADGEGILAALLVIALSALFAFTTISSAALSLEGHNLWVIKSMPISSKTVLLAKTLPHIIICLPAALVSAVLLIIASSAGILYWIFFFLCPAAVCILGAFLGSFLNVCFPKLEFENDAQPIKQSAASTLTMFSLMLYAVIVGGGVTLVSIFLSPIAALCAFFAVTAALAVLFAALLFTVGKRKYEALPA